MGSYYSKAEYDAYLETKKYKKRRSGKVPRIKGTEEGKSRENNLIIAKNSPTLQSGSKTESNISMSNISNVFSNPWKYEVEEKKENISKMISPMFKAVNANVNFLEINSEKRKNSVNIESITENPISSVKTLNPIRCKNYSSFRIERKYSLDYDSGDEMSTIFSEDYILENDFDDKINSSFTYGKHTNLFDEEDEDAYGYELSVKASLNKKHSKEMKEVKDVKAQSKDIRNTYLTKLICCNIWKPESEEVVIKKEISRYNSIIIFDWDDTLFATSHICPGNKVIRLTRMDIEDLKKLQNTVVKILNYYKDKGDLFIVTNSSYEWLQFSAQNFFPKVYELFKDLRIISAREEFEKFYPDDMRQWKISTFKKIKGLYTDKLTNILSFGDNEIELESAYILGQEFKEAYIKTVKFKKGPLLGELTKQLKIVYKSREEILTSTKNLKIQVEKKPKEEVKK